MRVGVGGWTHTRIYKRIKNYCSQLMASLLMLLTWHIPRALPLLPSRACGSRFRLKRLALCVRARRSSSRASRAHVALRPRLCGRSSSHAHWSCMCVCSKNKLHTEMRMNIQRMSCSCGSCNSISDSLSFSFSCSCSDVKNAWRVLRLLRDEGRARPARGRPARGRPGKRPGHCTGLFGCALCWCQWARQGALSMCSCRCLFERRPLGSQGKLCLALGALFWTWRRSWRFWGVRGRMPWRRWRGPGRPADGDKVGHAPAHGRWRPGAVAPCTWCGGWGRRPSCHPPCTPNSKRHVQLHWAL